VLVSGRNVFEELGEGFTLLSLDADSAVSNAFVKAAEEMRIPLKVVGDDPGGEGRNPYEAAHVLVRPDQFVVWASGEEPIDPKDILRRAIGTV